MKPDDSHIDEMREAVRGDFERSRRSNVLSQQLAGEAQDVPEPSHEDAAPLEPKRFRLWRR